MTLQVIEGHIRLHSYLKTYFLLDIFYSNFNFIKLLYKCKHFEKNKFFNNPNMTSKVMEGQKKLFYDIDIFLLWL